MLVRTSLISTALMCSIACGQSQIGTVTHHLTFREVDPVTHLAVSSPNGIIEPGEAALISLSMSFTPPVGTVIQPPPPQPGPLTVVALRGGNIHVLGYSGIWRDWSLRPGWDTFPVPGIEPKGHAQGFSIYGIIIQQQAQGAETSNPVEDIWRGVWQPSSYTNRLEYFQTWHWGISSNSALWLSYAGPPEQYFTGQAFTSFAQIHVPIAIPAPGAGALFALCLAAAGAGRSRRKP